MAMNMDAMLKIRAQVDGANNIIQLNRGLQSVESTAKNVTGAMRGLTGASAGLSGALGTLAPLLSVAGLVGMVKGTIEAGDAMNDLSQRTGVSVEALARFKKAAAVSGTDIESVSKALVKLSQTMLNAKAGGDAQAATFKTLGISIADSKGQMKTADSVMLEVANRFKAMPDGVAKTALALRLLGKSGAEMIPMLNMGGDAIDKLKVKMTEAFAKKADEYSDRLAILGGKVGALGMDLTVALLPALEAVTSAVTTAVDAFNQLPDALKGMAVAGATLAIAWGPLTGLLKSVVAGFEFLAGVITPAIEYFTLTGASLEGLAVAFTDLGFAIAAVPIAGWIAAAVAGLAALSVGLYQNNKSFKNWADTSVNFIKVVASDGISTLGRFTQWVGQQWNGLVALAKKIGSSIADAFSGPFGVIANVAKSVFGYVAQQMVSLYQLIPAPLRAINEQGFKYLQGAWNRAAGMNVSPSPAGGAVTRAQSFAPDLGALDTSAASNAKKESDKSEQERLKLLREGGAALLAQQYVKDQAQINDLKRVGNQLQSSGNNLKAYEVEKSSAILEAQFDLKKLQDETVKKLQESKDDTDQRNRSLRDQVIIAEAANKQGEIEERQRSSILDIDQKIAQERKRQAKEQADAMRSIQDRVKYQRIGDLQGSEQAARQKELDDLKRQKKEQPERADDIQKRIDALKKSWSEMDAMANSASYGIAKGIRGYLESIGNMADAVANATKNVLSSLEDRLMEFFSTGKFNFKDFANYAIQQLQRIVLQQLIIKPLMGALGNLFPFLKGSANGNVFAQNGIQPFAMGGVVTRPTIFPFANGTGLMGEAGPEAIIPLKRGRDGRLGVSGGGGDTNVVVNVDASGSNVQGDNNQGAALGRVIAGAVQAELIKQKRPGGLLAA